ncbi:HAD-IA family hydrolase [Halobacillus salinarum]|uniref:HAD-IA family hydrolase n=1 Tax=Halobacillus salinarum TaxID=2932257 RepID=A0ABY4EM51_9BACI|nr:HAD-IA family hydrolase [Halobacillus salinarum]UOQ45465.1 HAD-IA family hydrolase [Halobacillus salinarum]
MYRHIIWDFDGTLFDTYPVMAGVFKELLESEGMIESVETIEKQWRISASHALSYYQDKYKIDDAFIADYKRKKLAAEMEQSKPFAEIEALCKYIASTGRKNYLLTHRGESSIELLRKYDLERYFSQCITSKEGFARKPSPAAIHHLMSEHQIEKTEAIMIGDRDLDLISGKNAGISACYFTNESEGNEHCDYIIHDFKQLYSII